MNGERGFTLLDVLIGAGISALVGLALVAFADRLVAAGDGLHARLAGAAAADRVTERLASEAAGAWAVYRAATDVLGNDNSDGHEVDFYAQDGSHRAFGWAYRFDAAKRTLTRYAFAPGVAGSAVPGEIVTGLDAFSVSAALPPAELGDPESPLYDPLFAGANVTSVSFPLTGGAYGGNALLHVHVSANGVDRTDVLAGADAPTSFVVVVTYTPSPRPIATPTPPQPTLNPAPTP
jgi:type II secretory pathway pseudopilin PulG